MPSRRVTTGLLLTALCLAGPANAEDWKANATRIDAVVKAFDPRQSFTMGEPCKAEYSMVSPNRKQVTFAKIDLKLVDGESIANGAGSYTVDFNFSRVDFDCLRGGGRPNCTNGGVSFGHVPVKPGSEPAFCKMFIAAIATCQGVDSFKPSKRGCHLLDWEKEFVENGPPKKPVSRIGR